jgi:RHS repeat-associated protein
MRTNCHYLLITAIVLSLFSPRVAAQTTFIRVTTLAQTRIGHDVLKTPEGVAVDPVTGNVYVSDTGHHQIKVITPAGEITVLVGSGKPGLKDGVGAAAELKAPKGLAFDRVRRVLYVADSENHVIRRLGLDGAVTRYAGSGQPGSRDAAAGVAEFKQPCGVAVDGDGVVYVADTANSVIRRVAVDGTVTTIAGTGRDGLADGAAATARFARPEGIAVSSDGRVYIADTANDRIRVLDHGMVSTLAVAPFQRPRGLAIDESGDLLVADSGKDAIRRVSSAGVVTTITLPVALDEPSGVAVAGMLIIADTRQDAIRAAWPGLHLTDVAPQRGPIAGGNDVRIHGSGFVPGRTTVTIGGADATDVTWISASEITATAPAHTSGAVDVTVATPAGTGSLTAAYTFAAPPTIVSVSPTRGRTAGGQPATVRGTELAPGETEVLFGSAAASAVVVNDPTSASVTTPVGAAGLVDVTVRTPLGQATLPNAFRYYAPPSITAFAPASGFPGTAVTITGTNFDPEAGQTSVSIGGRSVAVVSVSSTSIVAVVQTSAASGRVIVATTGGTATSSTDFIVPVLVSVAVAPLSVSLDAGMTQQFTARGAYSDTSSIDVTGTAAWSSSNTATVTVDPVGLAQGRAAGTATITATFAGLAGTAQLQVRSSGPPPPIPWEAAPPLPKTEITSFLDGTSFLYDGPSATQTGVAPGTIDPVRAGVIRGTVTTATNVALAGVAVSILGRPEFGQTLTRADGQFDLAVNGGGPLVVVYQKSGYLPVHRAVKVGWQSFTTVPPAILTALDPAVTEVVSSGPVEQVARGSVSNDASGRRQATLRFVPGTAGEMVLADGTTQPLPVMHVRATEYTVGSQGPRAMPASLPPTTAYTYCVELSADEALAAGAREVRFNKPVNVYVENFLGFPIGGVVPVGYYDRALGQWVPSDNGRVIRIVDVSGGSAAVDSDGDESADDATTLALLGIDAAERQQLATLYSAGTSLWRTQVTHFTPWDHNWPATPPPGATGPQVPPPSGAYWIRGGRRACGSVLDCENQTLGEVLAVQGVSFPLAYNSGRTRGRRSDGTIVIPISGPTLPPNVTQIDLDIEVAGRTIHKTLPVAPNQTETFAWDGIDAYGRSVVGTAPATIRVGYTYPAFYEEPGKAPRLFGIPSGVALSGNRARDNVTLTQETVVNAEMWDSRALGLGGWSLGVHHFYDFNRHTLFLGDGSQRTSEPGAESNVIRTVAGTGRCCGAAVSGRATDLQITDGFSLAATPSGDVYINERNVVRKLTPTGMLIVVAGTGETAFEGDTRPGAAARINARSIAAGPDGSLYLNERNRVRRQVGGALVNVAGTGLAPTGTTNVGDNGPAVEARIDVRAISVGPDGTLYILQANATIRRVTANGIIQTIAGGGTDQRNDIPALTASLSEAYEVTLGADNSLYLVEPNRGMIRRIGPDGVIRAFAGKGITRCGSTATSGDGGLAVDACINQPFQMTIDRAGTVYFTEFRSGVIRSVTPDGMIKRAAGRGVSTGEVVQGELATASSVVLPWSITAGPDGSIYFAEERRAMVRRIQSAMPQFDPSETRIASADGTEIYVFRGSRHLRTVAARDGALRYEFHYDAAGLVVEVVDEYGLITKIEREGSGDVVAIVAPGGQRTTLAVNAAGYLATIVSPAGATHELTYDDGGLLQTMKVPRGGTYRFTYDAVGRLLKDTDPAGGFKALSRTGPETSVVSTMTTAGGQVVVDRAERFADGRRRRTSTDGAGIQTQTELAIDGSSRAVVGDGTVITTTTGPDPRFGMQAPMTTGGTITLPSGLRSTTTQQRTALLSDSQNPLSVTSEETLLTVNGKVYRSVFTAASHTSVATSPLGRQVASTIDTHGRVTQMSMPKLAPVVFTYTARGEVGTIDYGGRLTTFGYDAVGRLAAIRDPLGRTVVFSHDPADRPIRQVLTDSRDIAFSYDAEGNLTSLTPPGRPAHAFTFTPVNLPDSYRAPGAVTQYAYDLDRNLRTMTLPDGSTVTPAYDGGGRLTSLTSPGQKLTYSYLPSGNLASITGAAVSTAYTYDGPLLTRATFSGAVAGAVSWTYDNDFRVTSETAAGSSISFGYDADGILISAGALTLQRDPDNGMLTGSTLGGIAETYTYNTFGEVTAYAALANGTSFLSLSYQRDALGRVTSIGDRGYEYDPAGRLAKVTSGGVAVAEYEYDTNSNRTVHRWVGGTNTATYDDQDRLITYGDRKYEYTPNGHLKSQTLAGATTAYEYDTLGNLRRVVLPGGMKIDYVIDSQNRRVGRKVNGALVQAWLYADQIHIVAELDSAGAVTSRFVYGSRTNIPDYMIRAGVTYRLVSDHLGSPRFVVNTVDGTVTQRMDYDEFGRVTSDTKPGFQPFGFAGGLYDRDTGFVRFGARDYDPAVGRWTAKDPIGFGGGDANLYGYVFNDPFNSIDPFGLSGTISIYTSDRTGSSAPVWDGHAWIVYTQDGAATTSYGTYGPMVAAPRGLNQNWEIDHWADYGDRTGNYDVVSRTTWIDDEHERAFMDIIERYRHLGENAWSPTNACSGFAREAWFAATGERLSDQGSGDAYGNPGTLGEALRRLNGGVGARLVRRKP